MPEKSFRISSAKRRSSSGRLSYIVGVMSPFSMLQGSSVGQTSGTRA